MEKTFKYNVLRCRLCNEQTDETFEVTYEYPYTVKDTFSRLKTRISRDVRKKYGDHVNLAAVIFHRVRFDLYEMPNEYFRAHSDLIWSHELSAEEVKICEDRKTHTKISVGRPADNKDT